SGWSSASARRPERAGAQPDKRAGQRPHNPDPHRGMRARAAILLVCLAFPGDALAQGTSLQALLPAGDATAAGRMIQILLAVTVLSVAPGLLIMVTCFTRFVIALSFLRAGLGLTTTPANLVLISLALFMTFYTMSATFDQAWQNGLKPYMENKLTEQQAYEAVTSPLRAFMQANVREK